MTKSLKTLAALTVFAGLSLSGQAFAHAHLASATPADKATVATAPKEIDLSFTEGLELKFSGVEVTGPEKEKVQIGTPTLSEDKKALTVPLNATLKPGTYTVDWHALSVDGHKSKGSTSFTIKP
ncbi:copper homeostasis periplasmic binding protein CopC [Allorhizobium terrae]|uniref:Copper homeostasis periplasmic binding protein CopC n=1 Tax=Allorhizobium terrae TaxID=1848972 RepID=A0A4S3ZWH6_9HYPH|nr:copper homeostasis periplasmic binding protein CopC [Allorhizobium terrae]THF50185.1 copper homeostasis periplasmic binding protein CopC [Allorhizobium terrae]